MHEYPMAGPHGPPMHHRPPMHHPPHPHYMPRPYMPRPHHPPFEKMENKKDKFPNYLHHVQPEDDPLATRTLFAGNLEINISDEELRRIFGRYGIVEDIDIKRPPPGTGNAFAFVRYQTLDMAHRAKVELSGQYIGKFQCKIGYGKATPTTRVWVGGLGPWTSVAQLEREFDRFGAIKKIEYAKGEPHAYILYDSIDAAQAAVKEMRGFPLGGPDRRLRIDFADVGTGGPYRPKPYAAPVEEGRSEGYEGYEGSWEDGYSYGSGYRGRGGHRGRGRGMYRGVYHGSADYRDEEWRRAPDAEYDSRARRSGSREPGVDRSRSRSPRRRSPDSDSDGSPRRSSGMLASARTLPEVVRKATTIWNGALILKNSLFPTKFHLTDGDSDIIDSLMKDEEGKNQLRITQRLRLDQPKLDDVQKRIATSSSHAIFLGVAGSTASITNEDASIQTRPMRNLVSYLKQKEAAGVISLLNKETEATGVLYSFPPCDFSTELLKRTCHNLTEESLKEDHLVIVVVRGEEDAKKYEAYLAALKQLRKSSFVEVTPREKHRNQESKKQALLDGISGTWSTVQQATRIAIIASLVPDEIIYRHSDHSVRSYETALMFIDVSGFTKLCETYTKTGGGPSRLTQVLNSYIGAMVQEILTHKGDVLKFSGDAFLSMWKKSPRLNMQDVVHTAIDCGLLIQKNYGRYMTDVGVVLKVKVAISAGLSHFSIIGGGNISQTQYVIVGQPVWDVKMAEYMSAAGDVLTSASAWMYVNEAEYCTQPCGDGRHTKVLGVGASWKRVEKLRFSLGMNKEPDCFSNENLSLENFTVSGINYREYAHRPAVVAAMRGTWWPALRQFMVPPILRAVDNDEPMDFLTEVRHVVVVCINIITRTVTETVLIEVVDTAYKCVYSVTSEAGGLVNKISMFDKDMMLLVVFGLRGLKHEDEAQKALQCASQLKESLDDVNIINVSIAVTSGLTYCGVVGHVLRREYTVIGSAVNKAARLMMAYPNKVTCDKETFLKSKINQECFKLVETKPLKGICKPGPIYEFSNPRKTERITYCRHPILGRNEELRKYKMTLHNALDEHPKSFTRYRDHKFGVAFIGPKLVGKTRLMQECINITPSFVLVDHFVLTEKDKLKFGIIRLIMKSIFKCGGKLLRENRENRILTSIDMTSLGPLEIYGINTVFDCRFPLPENYAPTCKLLDQFKVKEVIKEICRVNLPSLRVVAVAEGQYIDDDSWQIIILLLGAKLIFLLVSISEEETLSATATICLANAMIIKLPLSGIDRWYHAALACQLLDVQAIQSDLEKIIESASEGLPGWIQNFVISLVQRGQLTMMTMSRSEALEMGAVTPSPALLETDTTSTSFEDIECSKDSYSYVLKQGSVAENEMIQMAVLTDTYDFENMKVDVKMDALILKTYDSLTPFEKMLLKCGSVLGEVFSRCMLLHLLQSDSPRRVAQAHCQDLPSYAFCGYMKFRHNMFRTTTYELLTESQKGLIHESKELNQIREQICALSTETKMTSDNSAVDAFSQYQMSIRSESNIRALLDSEDLRRLSRSMQMYRKDKRIRSFSSLELSICECLPILLSAYSQAIEHCHGADDSEKLFEAYLEYADLSIINMNIPQAVHLLSKVEEFVLSDASSKKNEFKWVKDFKLGRIHSLRGACLLECGDLDQARKELLQAMRLFCDPFPSSKNAVRFRNLRASFSQIMALFIVPQMYVATTSGFVGDFYEAIAWTLNRLYRLFNVSDVQHILRINLRNKR
ncbi:RNA recognition motif protein [Danaus plexippus plexippus]|uniref:RNA recognition motif protein n=1 Tax=Danaus plexippus plexippus TaxID=278856 RepID=A0A212EH07_DANPL|nr:RNA recognition motif protein [Danaus plexippus plexippus]